jgi:hypothetical protein
MHSACGSALTAALNVDGLNLIQSQPAKALNLNVPPSLLADGMMGLTMECPLLAQSGHRLVHRTCPLLGVKRTSACALQMSDPKPTWSSNLSFCLSISPRFPLVDFAGQQRPQARQFLNHEVEEGANARREFHVPVH